MTMTPDELAALREYYDNTSTADDMLTGGRWETDVDPDPMVTTSLRLPKSLLDWVREQAVEQRVKPTALIRRWIEDRRAGADDDVVGRLTRLEQAVFHRAG